MSRKVVAAELLSLDGVVDGLEDLFVGVEDEVLEENLARGIAATDTVLLGRRTFDQWAGFWPTSRIEPFASFINAVEKFVVTSSPLTLDWAHSSTVTGPLPEFVRSLKEKPGGDIRVLGSIQLTRTLLEAGLLDELQLVIAPALKIRGRKLFDAGTPRRFTLTRSVISPNGFLVLDFRV
ncbi:MAG TPA: dihydrofolate reductase family protein [Thermoplasmata archaeon]|nr:dihydrofolate reductase family protein [Thermoplasmata archaeon]